jgi:hypothetical protein
MSVEGNMSWVERKGPSIVIVHGAPVWASEALLTEVWVMSKVLPKKKK